MNNENYLQHNNGDVYKVMPNYLLKVSPWKDGEDRRLHEYDMGSFNMITYKNACMIVNKQFDSTVEEWDHHGKHFIANSIAENTNSAEHCYLLSTLPNHKVMLKQSKALLNSLGNNSLTITSEDGMQELKLVKHKGKVYYILIMNEYLPRVQAYNMFGEFCQWIGLDHCKPIFNETDRKYV